MADVLEKITAIKRISDVFIANRTLIGEGVPEWVNRTRKPALEAFQRMGIPGFRTENYKYTDLTRL